MIGKTISHYKIISKLGEGGMGVVYQAQDTKLDREVALKFLPANQLGTEDDLQRFEQEAKAAAKLSHANIAHVYEINEHEGQTFIAMEYVDGKTLSEKIEQGPLKLEEAVKIATQLAEGLQAAHEKQIIHRDIKSANIMITTKGVVKIMDFGLAKLSDRTRLTKEGTTLGTAAYMSPEQARGESVDPSSDIWSLGIVLYEMVSGQLPFKGDYEQALVYSILNENPQPLTALRSGLPLELDRIVLKAMAKDPKERYRHVEELPVDLRAIVNSESFTSQMPSKESGATVVSAAESIVTRTYFRKWALALAFIGIVGLAIAGWINRENFPKKTIRFLVPVPEGYLNRYGIPKLALSPDGRTLVYGSGGQLYIKTLDTFEGEPLIGTEGADTPFFSPEGEWLGFNQGGTLKKLSIGGGPIVDIARDVGATIGASWGMNGDIIYGVTGSTGLWRIPSADGEPEPFTSLVDSSKETSHLMPQLLPGGEQLIFTVTGQSGGWDDARLVIMNLKTGMRKTVLKRATSGKVLPTGHLIYAQDSGALIVVPFDLERLEVNGTAVPILSDVRMSVWGGRASYAISDNGTLAFVRGAIWTGMSIRSVNRDGSSAGKIGTPLYGHHMKLDPKGQKLAMTIRGANNDDIFLIDTKSGERERFTFHSAQDETPVWSPDGSRVAYGAPWPGQEHRIYSKSVAANEEPILLHTGKRHLHLSSWSPNGQWLAMIEFSPLSQQDILALEVKTGKVIPIATTGVSETDGQFSPDGRWIAYSSNETGIDEIYLVSFPETSIKRQVSTNGGLGPRWAAGGNLLFYWSNGSLMEVNISQNGFSHGAQRRLFRDPDMASSDFNNDVLPDYDVFPDGTRFLLLATKPEAAATEIHVVLNWFEELKQLVPVEN